MTSTPTSGMSGSLISPSGAVLLHRSSCMTEPAEEARAMAVRVGLAARRSATAGVDGVMAAPRLDGRASVAGLDGLTSGDAELVEGA